MSSKLRQRRRAHDWAWPPHSAKNLYIHHGYSVPSNWKDALFTLVRVDNETANVWSALLGVVPLLVLYCNIASIVDANHAFDPTGVYIAMAFFSVNIMLTSGYHIFCQVPHLYGLWTALDFAGINCALLSVALGMWSYGHRILPMFHWKLEIIAMFTLALIATILAGAYRILTDSDPFWLQAFNILIAYGIFPAFAASMPLNARNFCFIMLVAGGAIVHVLKVPERFISHVFDHFGHSHCVWHAAYTAGYYCFFSSIVATATDRSLLWDDRLFTALETTIQSVPTSLW